MINSEGTAIAAAPIIVYMRGWSLKRIEAYCARKDWLVDITRIDPYDPVSLSGQRF